MYVQLIHVLSLFLKSLHPVWRYWPFNMMAGQMASISSREPVAILAHFCDWRSSRSTVSLAAMASNWNYGDIKLVILYRRAAVDDVHHPCPGIFSRAAVRHCPIAHWPSLSVH